MNIDRLATRYEIALPAWIEDALSDVPEVLPTLEARGIDTPLTTP